MSQPPAGLRPAIPPHHPGRLPVSGPRRRPGAVRGAGEGRAAWPGLWGCVLTALLSGAGCWFLGAPRLASLSDAGVDRLEEVAPADLPSAIATLSPSGGVLERLRRERGCEALAFVTLAAPPGGPPARVRLRSGSYFSPAILLTATPVRVAIPYPAPVEAGRGTLTVLSDGGEAVVALLPAWHLPIAAGEASRVVTWRPGAGCAAPHG